MRSVSGLEVFQKFKSHGQFFQGDNSDVAILVFPNLPLLQFHGAISMPDLKLHQVNIFTLPPFPWALV